MELQTRSHTGRIDQATLLKRAANGKDGRAFEALYKRYYKELVRYVRRRIGTAADAEDVTQNVFLYIWQRGSCYRADRSSPEAFLFAIANNATAEHLRKKKRWRRSDHAGEFSEGTSGQDGARYADRDPLSSCRFSEVVQKMEETLSPAASEAIRLRYIDEMCPRQAASKVGCSVKAFYSRVERGLKVLEAVCESPNELGKAG